MSEIVPFSYSGQRVRTLVDFDGNTWFVAADVCQVLGLSNPAKAARGLDRDEVTTSSHTDSSGRAQEMLIISEPGLYTLLVRSRRPEAKPFRRWVTHEVLPALRRTGTYSVERRSAETAPVPVADPLDALQGMLDRLRENRDLAVRALTGMAELDVRVTAIESAPAWCTATGWAVQRGWPQNDLSSLQRLGTRAGRIARSNGLHPSKVMDIQGRVEVNRWPLSVWDQAANELGWRFTA